jgi:hypothetical protein
MTAMNTLEDLEDEMRILQAKFSLLEQKKLEILETEGRIRVDMERVQNQIDRLKIVQKKTTE